jgi:hypothetical protein
MWIYALLGDRQPFILAAPTHTAPCTFCPAPVPLHPPPPPPSPCTGEVLDDAEMRRRNEETRRANEPHFYAMEMAPGLFIDARLRGNLSRLINSSCDPNCEAQKWVDASNKEVGQGDFRWV